MKILKNIKFKIGQKKMQKTVRKPETNAVACNLYKAKAIGIVFNASLKQEFDEVNLFIENLKKQITIVEALGYVESDNYEEFHETNHKNRLFNKTDLTKFFKPKSSQVKEFCETEFDILIDLNIKDCLPLSFVIAESKALFKTGLYSEKEPNYYDLMLKIDKDSKNIVKNLIIQTEQYLKMINT